jgi:hypothetical protein
MMTLAVKALNRLWHRGREAAPGEFLAVCDGINDKERNDEQPQRAGGAEDFSSRCPREVKRWATPQVAKRHNPRIERERSDENCDIPTHANTPEKEAAEQRLDSFGPLREADDNETRERESVSDNEPERGVKWPCERKHEREAYRKRMLSDEGH